MTTTVGAMERTIQLIHEQLPGTAVMVGGAVITQEFADQIGADFYAKDAAASTASPRPSSMTNSRRCPHRPPIALS